jgi:predicted DNA-binding transcriptional regulator AlpA
MKNDKIESHVHPELIDSKVAARIAGVSTDTLRRLVREEGAPPPVRVRRSVRWRRRDLLAWIEEGCPACPRGPKGTLQGTDAGGGMGRAL